MSTADMPVAPGARYDSLDVLRGLAVLMIFAVNVKAMLAPYSWYENPTLWSGQHDMIVDRVLAFAVDGKWVTVFAILFGAGLALIWQKTEAAGGDPTKRLLKRQGWLLVFGLVHLFLIWAGDILTAYALTGMVALPFLHRRSVTIGAWAAGLFALSVAWIWGLYALLAVLPGEAGAEMGAIVWGTDEAVLAEEIAAYRSSSLGAHLQARLPMAFGQLFGLVFSGLLPMLLSYMLAGVLLFRTGYLLAQRSAALYLIVGVCSLAAAFAVDAVHLGAMEAADWSFTAYLRSDWLGLIEGPLGGLGYLSLVMALVRAGIAPKPLAAAGRMAFTNYVLCSLIGTTVALGHAGGLYARVTLAEAMGLVLIVWTGLLILSPLWLSAFRYGPLEWLWRSLAYGRRQPFRNKDERARSTPSPAASVVE